MASVGMISYVNAEQLGFTPDAAYCLGHISGGNRNRPVSFPDKDSYENGRACRDDPRNCFWRNNAESCLFSALVSDLVRLGQRGRLND